MGIQDLPEYSSCGWYESWFATNQNDTAMCCSRAVKRCSVTVKPVNVRIIVAAFKRISHALMIALAKVK